MEDLRRLRQVPAGAELLPAVRLARRIRGRRPVALHQRARARQHPEGRHLFGRAAHVGRRDQRGGTARHRRRGRQVRHPDGESHRRPADRPARRAQGTASGRLGATSTPRAWSRARPTPRAADGEDLRRLGLVPLRHAGFHRRSASSWKSSCGARGRRTRSSSPSPAARATAPRRPARTSA